MKLGFLQSWPARRFIWDSMFILIFKGKEAKPIAIPTKEHHELIQSVPMASRIPAISIKNIMVADRITQDEKVT